MTIKSVSQKKYTTRRRLSRTCTKLSKGKKHRGFQIQKCRTLRRNTRHVRGIRKTPLGRVAHLKHKQKQSKRQLLRSTRNLLTSQQRPWKHLRGGGTTSILNFLKAQLDQNKPYVFKQLGNMTEGNMTEGNNDGQLHKPCDISSVPTHRNIIIVTTCHFHQVCVYDITNSQLLCKMGKADGSEGQGDGEFNEPWGVVVTKDSACVIVADGKNGRVQVLSLVVSDGGRTAKLGFMREIGKGQLNRPRGLALRDTDDSQTVLVAETGGNQVSEWSLEGTKVHTFDTGLNFPSDVTVLPVSGQIAIADEGNNHVSVFDGKSGNFVRIVGERNDKFDLNAEVQIAQWQLDKANDNASKTPGLFYLPSAITADAEDNMIVIDTMSSRLQVFDKLGQFRDWTDTLGETLVSTAGGFKGVEWLGGEGWGRLIIANNSGNDVRVFNYEEKHWTGVDKTKEQIQFQKFEDMEEQARVRITAADAEIAAANREVERATREAKQTSREAEKAEQQQEAKNKSQKAKWWKGLSRSLKSKEAKDAAKQSHLLFELTSMWPGADSTIGQVRIELINKQKNFQYDMITLFKILRQHLDNFDDRFYSDYTVHYNINLTTQKPQVIVVFFRYPLRSVDFNFAAEEKPITRTEKNPIPDTAETNTNMDRLLELLSNERQLALTVANADAASDSVSTSANASNAGADADADVRISGRVEKINPSKSIPKTNSDMHVFIDQIKSTDVSQIRKGLEEILSMISKDTEQLVYTLDFAAKQGISCLVNLLKHDEIDKLDVLVVDLLRIWSGKMQGSSVPKLPRVVISVGEECWDLLFLCKGNPVNEIRYNKKLVVLSRRVAEIINGKESVILMSDLLKYQRIAASPGSFLYLRNASGKSKKWSFENDAIVSNLCRVSLKLTSIDFPTVGVFAVYMEYLKQIDILRSQLLQVKDKRNKFIQNIETAVQDVLESTELESLISWLKSDKCATDFYYFQKQRHVLYMTRVLLNEFKHKLIPEDGIKLHCDLYDYADLWSEEHMDYHKKECQSEELNSNLFEPIIATCPDLYTAAITYAGTVGEPVDSQEIKR